MEKLIMDRRASENKYLHRDFHKSLDLGIKYVGERYGDNGVKQYLRQFANTYYAPLAERIRKEGLAALACHIKSIYEAEEMPQVLEIELSDDKLSVSISSCPAVLHFGRIGYKASDWYIEATRTINETIADLVNLNYRQYYYNADTGECKYVFSRRNG